LRIEKIIDPEHVPVLALAGELDSSNAVILEEHTAEAIASAPARVAFDLAELRFMDSAGIAVLVTTALGASPNPTTARSSGSPSTPTDRRVVPPSARHPGRRPRWSGPVCNQKVTSPRPVGKL